MDDLKDTVEKMAKLSRIAISEEEKGQFATSLAAIIDYFEVLNTFDTSSVQNMYSVLETHHLSLREDNVQDMLDKEAFLKNAPSSVGGLIKVPQVLK